MVKNFCKSVLGILIVSILIEILLRCITPFSQPLRFYTQYAKKTEVTSQSDNTADCQLIPNTLLNGFVINSQGNYSPEYSFIKPPNTKRVVVIGDSALTATVPYAQSFIRIMEQQLQQKTDMQVQIINLGKPCIGPLAEKNILEEKGKKYDPDLVMLVLSLSNDFSDDQIITESETQRPTYKAMLQKFFQKSYLASFLKTYYLQITSHEATTQNAPQYAQSGTYIGAEYDPITPSFSESEYIDLTSNLADILIPNTISTTQLQSVQHAIREMQNDALNMNARFLVVLIPAEFQVNTELLASAALRMGRSFSEFDITTPQRLLTTYFDQLNIPYVDILSLWLENTDNQQYFHPRDTHLNVKGNESVASILLPILSQALQIENQK